MHFHRFALLVSLALIAVFPAVADRTPRQRASLTPRQQPSVIDTTEPSAEKIAKPFEVAEISRGGKGVVAFSSQSASILMGLILALNSGFMNGCALGGSVTADGSSQAVAAVTASWTNSALGLAAGNNGKFGFLAKVLGSFIFGSAIAGYLEPNPSLFSVSSKNYAAPLAVAAGLVLLAINKLGELGNVKMGFYLLAMANGINNSVTSVRSSRIHDSGLGRKHCDGNYELILMYCFFLIADHDQQLVQNVSLHWYFF